MFNTFATDLFMKRYNFSYTQSKNAVAMMPIMNMILIPIFSAIWSNIGKKTLVMLLASMLSVLTFTGMSLIPSTDKVLPYVAIVSFSIYWSLIQSVVWSNFTLSLPCQALTFMLGVFASFYNFIGAIMPNVYGAIQKEQNFDSYQNSLYVLIGNGILASFIAGWIYAQDLKGSRTLYLPENDPVVIAYRKKMTDLFEIHGDSDTVRTVSYLQQPTNG